MDLRIEPLTRKNWPAFAALFDTTGPVGQCWCMYPRIGPAYRKRDAAENRRDFETAAMSGGPAGLLAFEGELAVGWCAVTPSADVPYFGKTWPKTGGAGPVWRISCFYIRKSHRRRGMTEALIEAAVDHAQASGAKAIEARPLDASLSPSATCLGYVTTFAAAGFAVVDRSKKQSPIMRLAL